MAERLVFDIFAIDNASRGFTAAGRAASATSDDVAKLARRLDEIGTKSASARVGLTGDKDALLQIDRLQLKLLELGKKTSKPDVSLEGFARASVEISALERQMDRLSEKVAKPKVSLLGRLLGSSGGPGIGSPNAIAQLITGGGAAAAGPGAGLAVGALAGLPTAGALLVEGTGPGAGLAAATRRLGGFRRARM